MMQRGTTTPARGLLPLNGAMIAPTDLAPIASLRVGRPLAETPVSRSTLCGGSEQAS
jgi:hypothetical protein